MHTKHDALTLGAALLLWFVGLVTIGIAVLARMGRFTERRVEFADYATWLAAGLSVGAAASPFAVTSERFTEDGAEGVFFAIGAGSKSHGHCSSFGDGLNLCCSWASCSIWS